MSRGAVKAKQAAKKKRLTGEEKFSAVMRGKLRTLQQAAHDDGRAVVVCDACGTAQPNSKSSDLPECPHEVEPPEGVNGWQPTEHPEWWDGVPGNDGPERAGYGTAPCAYCPSLTCTSYGYPESAVKPEWLA